jgi:glycerophosphoryl diester phosphodiesterase
MMDKYKLRKPSARSWQVLIQSFSAASLQKIHALDPSLPLIQLNSITDTSERLRAQLDGVASYAVGIGPFLSNVDAALVIAAHERCLEVHPYTVNDSSTMTMLLALGVDGMFTNFPALLDQVLAKRAGPPKSTAAKSARGWDRCRRT